MLYFPLHTWYTTSQYTPRISTKPPHLPKSVRRSIAVAIYHNLWNRSYSESSINLYKILLFALKLNIFYGLTLMQNDDVTKADNIPCKSSIKLPRARSLSHITPAPQNRTPNKVIDRLINISINSAATTSVCVYVVSLSHAYVKYA